jgi:hypothetical protein
MEQPRGFSQPGQEHFICKLKKVTLWLSRILGNIFYWDDYLVSTSRDRTIRESCYLGFIAAYSSSAGTDLKAHDSLDGLVLVELFPTVTPKFPYPRHTRTIRIKLETFISKKSRAEHVRPFLSE